MGIMRWELEPIRTLGFGNITTSLSQIGDSFDFPIRMIAIYSTLDADVMLSFNGYEDHWFFPSKGSLILDVSANSGSNDEMLISRGNGVWVRHLGSSPTAGTIYISTMYGSSR